MIANKQTPQQQMPRPNTDLDFQSQLTDPFTSSDYVNVELKDKFKKTLYWKDEQGMLHEHTEYDLYPILQIFNRDWRLGNIDKREEAVYIRFYLDLCSDILVTLGDEYRRPAIICLERALCVNETSQAKGGFVRRILNTFIHKQMPVNDEDTKRPNFWNAFAKKR